MKQDRSGKLIKEIEELRKQLHDCVNKKQLDEDELLKNNEILSISKRLDELIIKYMSIK